MLYLATESLTVCILISRVPQSVLQVKFSTICQVLLNILAAKVDSQSTALLKSVSKMNICNCLFNPLVKPGGLPLTSKIVWH